MTICLLDGFDRYGDGEAPPAFKTFRARDLRIRGNEPYGFKFQDDEGKTLEVQVKPGGGKWVMTVKGEGEFIFNQEPHFLVTPL